MALQFASAGAHVKAFIPALLGLTARARRTAPTCKEPEHRHIAAPVAAPSPVAIIHLSPEAKSALAPLDLPPDGPIETGATMRTRLAPDVAARNFVSWARALDLTGRHSKRSIYALYCEFSEVDERPPLGTTRFLEALAKTEGISKGHLQNGKVRRAWQWTIEPAKETHAAPTVCADKTQAEPASAPSPAIATSVPVPAESSTSPLLPAKLAKPNFSIPNYVADADHPFSLAGLREGEKSARRLRLNAGAARKQRGALRRAA